MKTFFALAFIVTVASNLLAPDALAQSNSTVRFRVSFGTFPVGDIDVELFDQEKPASVNNFLTYAQSGAYSNSIIHECAPNSYFMGGFGTVANPTNTAPFSRLTEITRRAAISNEFFTGTRFANTSGTLAMALDPDPNDRNLPLPNSARAEWFFNTKDNNLNFDPKLYTVFGRVIAGTNVLNHFNQLTATNRIIATTNTACATLQLYPERQLLTLLNLPVGALLPASRCPRYSDLYKIEVIMLNARDVVGPQFAVTSPAANFITTNGSATVSGTVFDNVGVSYVVVEINGGPAIVIATNSGAFSTNLTGLATGTNVLVFTASDTSSNITQVTRRIFHRVSRPIRLFVEGEGQITGAADNALLDLGREYTVIAKPARGNLFGFWTEGTNAPSVITNPLSPTLKFQMVENLELTAHFGTNLFPAVQGAYNGLFMNMSDVQQDSSGYLTLKVGNAGVTSGKALLNGKSYSVKGSFNAFGEGRFTTVRKGTNALVFELQIGLTNDFDQLTGTVTEQAATGAVWTAQLDMDRAWFNGQDRIPSQAGKYTMLLPADTNAPGAIGDGAATVSVSTKGALSFSGTLADGTKVSQRTVLSKNGEWPLYVPLYKGKGSLLSWVAVTNETGSDFRGLFNWFKQAQVTKYYPLGFTNEALAIGSGYTPAGYSNVVLSLTNASIAFTNGDFVADFSESFDIDPKGKTYNLGTNKLKLTINKSSGLFSGTVNPPGTNRAMKFQGVIFPKQTNGAGFFLGTNGSGRVTIEAR